MNQMFIGWSRAIQESGIYTLPWSTIGFVCSVIVVLFLLYVSFVTVMCMAELSENQFVEKNRGD